MTVLNVPKDSYPQARDWNQFWSLEQTQQFTKPSWSKRRIIRVISPYVIKGKNALDAGCGSGFFSKFFCDQGMRTVALDYSEKALEIARDMTKGRARLIRQSLLCDELFSKIDERFDFIFTDGLLEHFMGMDQDKIIGNLRSILKDGGTLATFVPNRFSPWELIRPFFMPGIEETPFVLKKLVDVHERNGFKIVNKGGINTLPFAFSLDKYVGRFWGMLLFVIARKDE